jgi:hypothetical protein
MGVAGDKPVFVVLNALHPAGCETGEEGKTMIAELFSFPVSGASKPPRHLRRNTTGSTPLEQEPNG